MIAVTEQPWHAFYPEEVDRRVGVPDIPVTHFLQQAAAFEPAREALYFLGKRIAYGQVLEAALRFANAAIRLGLRAGDRVALMLPSCPQYVAAYYGTLLAGGIVVQTNPLSGEHDLEHLLADSGAVLLVCLDLVYPRAAKVRARTGVRHVVVTGLQDALPFPKNVVFPLIQKRKGLLAPIDSRRDEVHRWTEWLARAAPKPPGPLPKPDDVAVLQYTGGTTGRAKGAMLTHRNLVANVRQCQAWMYRCGYGRETILTAVPLFHVYGMTVCMNYGFSIGARLLLVPKFDPKLLLRTIHREKPTLFPGAPTLYIALLHHPQLSRYRLSSIRCCISGSAPLPLDVQERFERLTGGRIVEGFGLSETSPVTHCNPIWGRNVNGSIGVPWPSTEARIVAADGGEAAVGEIGELAVRGPQVMKGYWNQPEETAAALKDGWLLTGDLARMDADGYFYIVDRKKDVILASGFNVYPREVEDVLFDHPAVREAAVIGVPDAYRGETVKAFVVLREGTAAEPEELDAFCRERLAPYKVPRQYEFREELPKSFVGKTLRRVLVEEERRKARQETERSE